MPKSRIYKASQVVKKLWSLERATENRALLSALPIPIQAAASYSEQNHTYTVMPSWDTSRRVMFYATTNKWFYKGTEYRGNIIAFLQWCYKA